MVKRNHNRSREDPSVRRAQIVDEAMRLVGQHGYNGFTINALAVRCGISNAGLLHYFGSKDEVLLALLEEIERRDIEVLAPLVAPATNHTAGEQSSWAAMFTLLRTMVVLIVERAELGRLAVTLQSESLDPSHPAHDWFCKREAATLNLFVQLVERFVPEPWSTARQLYALNHGLLHQWLRADREFDLVAEWEKAIAAVLPAVFAGPRSVASKP